MPARPYQVEVETKHTATVRVRIIPTEKDAFLAAKRFFTEAITKAAEAYDVAEDWESSLNQVYMVVFSSDIDKNGVFAAAMQMIYRLAETGDFADAA